MIFDVINWSIEIKKQIISNEDLILRNEIDFKISNELKMFCHRDTCTNGRKMNDLLVILLYIPSNNKPRIQLAPKIIEPIICKIVEQ